MQPAVFQTLADPSRLQIVEALLSVECPVNDLVARLDIHQSGVSRHLRILEEAGFVRMRPDGPRAKLPTASMEQLAAERKRQLERIGEIRENWRSRYSE